MMRLDRVSRQMDVAGILFAIAALAGCHAKNPSNAPDVQAACQQVDSGRVAVNGTHLFYEAAGRGSAVVLLHAGNLDRRIWDPQFALFAREHRALAVGSSRAQIRRISPRLESREIAATAPDSGSRG